MARKYKITSRRPRGRTLTMEERYQRYLQQYEKRKLSLLARTNDYRLESQEPYSLYTFRELYAQKRAAGSSATNAVSEIVSNELYVYAEEIRALNGVMKSFGLQFSSKRARENEEYFKEKLSVLNQFLKKIDPSVNSYERRDYISEYVFGSE